MHVYDLMPQCEIHLTICDAIVYKNVKKQRWKEIGIIYYGSFIDRLSKFIMGFKMFVLSCLNPLRAL